MSIVEYYYIEYRSEIYGAEEWFKLGPNFTEYSDAEVAMSKIKEDWKDNDPHEEYRIVYESIRKDIVVTYERNA